MPQPLSPAAFTAALLREEPDDVAFFLLRQQATLVMHGMHAVARTFEPHLGQPPIHVAMFWFAVLYRHTQMPPMGSLFGLSFLAHVALTPEMIAQERGFPGGQTPEQALRGQARPRAVDLDGLADAFQMSLAYDQLTEPMARHYARVARAALPFADPAMPQERAAVGQAAVAAAMQWLTLAPPAARTTVRDAAITLYEEALPCFAAGSIIWATAHIARASLLDDRYQERRATGDPRDLYHAAQSCAAAAGCFTDATQAAAAYILWGDVLFKQYEVSMDPAERETSVEKYRIAAMRAPAGSVIWQRAGMGLMRAMGFK